MTIRIFAIISLLQVAALADSILLRDGSKLEGSVVREDGDDYIMRVKVSSSIWEERRMPKSDVLAITKKRDDQVAWGKIKNITPTPDLLDIEEYDERISQLNEFIKEHPSSLYVRNANKMLSELKNEQEVVAAGGVKYGGKLVTTDQKIANAYALDAQMAAKEFKELAASGQTIPALREWEKLQDKYSASRAYAESVPTALNIMQTQLSRITKWLETYEDRMDEQEAKLKQLPTNDRASVMKAIEDELLNYQRKVEKERSEGIKWVSLNPNEEKELDKAESMLKQSIRKLEQLKSDKIGTGDEAWRKAYKAVTSGQTDLRNMRSVISEARNAKLPSEYLDKLEELIPDQK